METIKYPYRKTKSGMIVGIFLLIISVPLLCLSSTLLSLFVFNPSNINAQASNTHYWITLLGILLFFLIIAIFGVTLICADFRKMEAVLTAESFSYGHRGRLTTIRLSEISRITAKTCSWSEYSDWDIIIEGINGQKITFSPGVSGLFPRTYRRGFNYQNILHDLLSRLPPNVQVDSSVRNFAETGKIGKV